MSEAIDELLSSVPVHLHISSIWVNDAVMCLNKISKQNAIDILERKEDDEYMIGRYERIIELIKNDEPHMAIAKLLADISALKVGQ